ncbi:hypothetical protein HCN44_008529 [Aphidius gifuensis]|uniref:Large ribosomal subunit protein uL24m n=1 Tax=Aphidius gifuensis TaxID=684658 RepID=A0A835CR60_APHGI|nr:probable 39S ribosomal protein L24, mitochondrial [Aphidius gifuensis]KAF7989855.1 hypothetical protein HCN44_008529 [Aphidius gifuensis]
MVRPLVDVLKKTGEFSKQYANLPERYVKRSMEQIYWQTPKGNPRFSKRIIQREQFKFSTHRPWTREFYWENHPGKKLYEDVVNPIKQWSWFRGDRVEILTGRDKGKQGYINQIIQERNWVLVEGMNTKLNAMGKTKNFPGIMVLQEQPLNVLNDIALVDPSDEKHTSFEWRYTEEGEHVRVSTRTGRIIPIPITQQETIDYKAPHLYNDQPKDTSKADAQKITYKAALKTFEMDIMEKMGIKEDRIPKKTYWY